MGATSASISSGLNACAQLSAGPSGDQGNASIPTSIHIKDFLKTVSMFPPVDDCDESCADSLSCANLNITERPRIPVQPRQTRGNLPSAVSYRGFQMPEENCSPSLKDFARWNSGFSARKATKLYCLAVIR